MHHNEAGSLLAGGNRVHRFRKREEMANPKTDQVPIIERYQQIAGMIHRTAVAPRGNRFIVACTCGYVTLTEIGSASGRASLVAQTHVLDEADKLYDKHEGAPNG